MSKNRRRPEAQEDYRVLEERSQADWEAKEKHVFEELGSRVAGGDHAVCTVGNEGVYVGKSTLAVSSGTQFVADV